ncbi:cytochrome c biogenesis protein CcdA [Aquipuribacter nitratireducens]|uniref:Cytochrome c biogenesis protein CcdA n=1 Tax=Aquipuribacter nitratireducens TaxID=650104 RepID=A0ABW0GU61_9MICO
MVDAATLSLALVAGLLAALNPCGFALLPAYLALVVTGGEDARPGRSAALVRALVMSGSMTVGFVAVFGAFAAVAVPLALSVERFLPWLTVVVGVLLVAAGGWLLAGRELAVVAPRAGSAPTGTARSMVGYGVAYALASLSCTVAPFLAVTTAALTTGGAVAAGAVFVVYALGMGAVVTTLAVAVALARRGLVDRMRRATPYVARASGGLLVVAGLYVAYYGVYELRVLSGGSVADPVVDAALALQGVLSRTAVAVGPWPLVAVVVATLLVVVVARVRGRRRGARQADASGAGRAEQEMTGR